MPDFKFSVLINGPRWGWSENWYTSATSLSGAIAVVSGYITVRIPLLTADHAFIGYRVGPVRRQDGPMAVGPSNFAGAVNGRVNNPQNAVLINCLPTSGRIRKFLMRGLNDPWCVGNRFNPPGFWETRFFTWANYIRANCSVYPRVQPGNIVTPVATIDVNGLCTTLANSGIGAGANFYFNGCRDGSGRPVSGIFRCSTATADPLAFNISRWIVGRTATGGTVISVPTRGLVPIIDVTLLDLTERKVGRPFELLRGLKQTVPRGVRRTAGIF